LVVEAVMQFVVVAISERTFHSSTHCHRLFSRICL
jgi:hypothetical protein